MIFGSIFYCWCFIWWHNRWFFNTLWLKYFYFTYVYIKIIYIIHVYRLNAIYIHKSKSQFLIVFRLNQTQVFVKHKINSILSANQPRIHFTINSLATSIPLWLLLLTLSIRRSLFPFTLSSSKGDNFHTTSFIPFANPSTYKQASRCAAPPHDHQPNRACSSFSAPLLADDDVTQHTNVCQMWEKGHREFMQIQFGVFGRPTLNHHRHRRHIIRSTSFTHYERALSLTSSNTLCARSAQCGCTLYYIDKRCVCVVFPVRWNRVNPQMCMFCVCQHCYRLEQLLWRTTSEACVACGVLLNAIFKCTIDTTPIICQPNRQW